MRIQILILISMVILSCFAFTTHADVVPEDDSLTIELDRSTQRLFAETESESILNFIDEKLRAAFWDAWKTYLRSRSAIKDEKIRTALDTLMTRLLNGERKLTVKFMYDGAMSDPLRAKAAGYYDLCKRKFMNIIGEGWMTLSDFKGMCSHDVHSYWSPQKNEIIIYNGVKNFMWKNVRAEDKDGCKYEGTLYRLFWQQTLEDYYPDWQPATDQIYSIVAQVFHELIHVAMDDAGINRSADEATVEDTMLKIFPRGTGFNSYESAYYFYLWHYLVLQESPAFEYQKDRRNRKFNPPYELVYMDNTFIDIVRKEGGKEQLDIKCDDAVSDPESVPFWVIPYVACKPYTPHYYSPGGDHGDDRYSVSSGNMSWYNLAPGVMAYKNGYYLDAVKLFDGLEFDGQNTVDEMLEVGTPLVIPSSGFFGKAHDMQVKVLLEEFVRRGGSLVVFSNQYGVDTENNVPVPEGETLDIFGFREDQSCEYLSSWIDSSSRHPALSAWNTASAVGSMPTDGYIDSYPGGSTVLLRRTKNRKPLMLSYPYGEGTVILTTLFTDWASAHGQSTTLERNIVRDTLTFAQDTRKQIPQYPLEDSQTISVSLNCDITNKSDTPAASVHLKVYNPDRTHLLFETTQPTAVYPGETAETTLDVTLGGISQLGIYHTYYDLLDSGGQTIQGHTPSPGGRFAVYKQVINEYTPDKPLETWITANKEHFFHTETPRVSFFAHNTTEQSITIKWRWSFQWGDMHELPNITIPAGQEIRLDRTIAFNPIAARYIASRQFLWLKAEIISGHDSYFQRVQKGFFVRGVQTSSTLTAPGQIISGTPLQFSIQSQNVTDLPLDASAVKVTLEQQTKSGYAKIATLYDKTHAWADGPFNLQENYDPEDPLMGQYRLKLEVRSPEQIPEIRYKNLLFQYSQTAGRIESVRNPDNSYATTLEPGKNYNFTLHLTTPRLRVTNGQCTLKVISETGTAAYEKTIANITLTPNTQYTINETFTFTPPKPGKYSLQAHYSDPSGYNITYRSPRTYDCGFHFDAVTTKESYPLGEPIQLTLTAHGHGSFTINILDESNTTIAQRPITFPENTHTLTETFQIPNDTYTPTRTLSIQMHNTACGADASGGPSGGPGGGSPWTPNWGDSQSTTLQGDGICHLERTITIPLTPVIFHLNCQTQLNQDIQVETHITGQSGFITPVTGQLTLQCPQLNYTGTQPVTIQPGENTVVTQIPLPASAASGNYGLEITFTPSIAAPVTHATQFMIPPPQLDFSPPPAALTAGETFTLAFTNNGGRDTAFDITAGLLDNRGQQLLEHADSFTIGAGETTQLTLTLPAGLKSGPYQLYQKAQTQNQPDQFFAYHPVTVTGVSVQLESYTLEQTYRDSETVTGKAEITAGTAPVTGGVLHASVVRRTMEGVRKLTPGNFIHYNSIAKGYDTPDTLYLDSDQGLLAVDKTNGAITLLHPPEFNCRALFRSASGELWVGTSYGVYRRSIDGQWDHYTIADGLGDNWINHLSEITAGPLSGTWVSTNNGLSRCHAGAWTTYTTSAGLPGGRVYRAVTGVNGSGGLWVSTSGGLCRFDGATFSAVEAPFNTAGIKANLAADAGGNGWAVDTAQYRNHVLYRYDGAQWEQWNLNQLYGGTFFAWHLETHNGAPWLRGKAVDTQGNERHTLLRCAGDFTFLNSNQESRLQSMDFSSIIPGDGENPVFLCELGYLEYGTGDWSHRFLPVDDTRLPGAVNCLAVDGRHRVWVGTDYGISMLEPGGACVNVLLSDEGFSIRDVVELCAGPGDAVYGFTPFEVVKIQPGKVEFLETPQEFWYTRTGVSLAVDTRDRIWLARRELYYYGQTLPPGSREWQPLPGIQFTEALAADRLGGVWVASWNDYSDGLFHLGHVQPDLSIIDYTPSGSGLSEGEKNHLHVDAGGRLWINHYAYGVNSPMQMYDGVQWFDARTFPGYPGYTQQGLGEDAQGQIFILGRDTAEGPGRLYTYDGSGFTPGSAELELPMNAPFLAGGAGGNGYAVDTSDFTLLQIPSKPGLGTEAIWTRSFPLDLNPGETPVLDLTAAEPFPPGSYTLVTRLVSHLEQPLAQDMFSFAVGDEQLALTLVTPGEGGSNHALKPGESLPVELRLGNHTANTYENQTLQVFTRSPGGTDQVLLEETLSLVPGREETRTVVFEAGTTGTWELYGQLTSGGGGGEEPPGEIPYGPVMEASGISAEGRLLFLVAEPAVDLRVTGPGTVGDNPFDVTLKVSNTAPVPAQCRVNVSSGDAPHLDDVFTLAPGEERILGFSDTAGSDKSYHINLTGDVTYEEILQVNYGYGEVFDVQVPVQALEGPVPLGIRLENTGSLTLADTLSVQISPLGNPGVIVNRTERFYTLSPGRVVEETISVPLGPGEYVVTYGTERQPGLRTAPLQVRTAGAGLVSLTGGEVFPVGENGISFRVSNSGADAGWIPLTFRLMAAGSPDPVMVETRRYYLQPGEGLDDRYRVHFPAAGDYLLTVEGPKLETPVSIQPRVLPLRDVSASLAIGTVEGGGVPVTADVSNNGFLAFTGSLSVMVDGTPFQFPVEVPGNTPYGETFIVAADGLNPGARAVQAVLSNASGEVLGERAETVQVTGPDIRVTGLPGDLEVDAGTGVTVPLTVENLGNRRGEVILTVEGVDNLFLELPLALEAGETRDIDGLVLDIPGDWPAGNYSFQYRLMGDGAAGGRVSGRVHFQVRGLSLEVEARLDRSVYRAGETARLTLDITPGTAGGPGTETPLEVVVNWGGFSEKREVMLTAGGAAPVFDIPLEGEPGEKIFYGIYFPGGKGIHLNDVYLRFAGAVTVETDRQVYEPGDVISAVFAAEEPGMLTAEAFGEVYTLELASSMSLSFEVPEETTAGTYGISWSFETAGGNVLSGGCDFDVAGLLVKVARAEFGQSPLVRSTAKSFWESGTLFSKRVLAAGGAFNAFFILESNRSQSLEWRAWVVAPSGNWDYLGASNAVLSAEKLTEHSVSGAADTGECGMHRLVYGGYVNGDAAVTGSLHFMVGNAALQGMTLNRPHYPAGDEDVEVTVHYFGTGGGEVELLLDGERADSRSISLDSGVPGAGKTVFTLSSGALGGGAHELEARLTVGGLTSRRETSFVYGAGLPDLRLQWAGRQRTDFNYTFTLEAVNGGKTASGGSAVSLSENGTPLDNVVIPPLQPGESYACTFPWNGTGKAGARELGFAVDPGNSVKEFSEGNNRLTWTVDVPAILYTLEVTPAAWGAHAEVPVTTALRSNLATGAVLSLHLEVTRTETGETVFQRDRTVELAAFGVENPADTFQTSTHPPGAYEARQSIVSADGTVNMTERATFFIEPTRTIHAALTLQPPQIPAAAATPLEITLDLEHRGNEPLEDEAYMLEIVNKDTGAPVQQEEWPVTLGVGEQKTETRTITVNLEEGIYEALFKKEQEVLAEVEFIAAAALKHDKTVWVKSRVLAASFPPIPPKEAGIQALDLLLQAHGVEGETARGNGETETALHKGYANIVVAHGHHMNEPVRLQLLERVHHGTGLLLFCGGPVQSHRWAHVLGLEVKPLRGKRREQAVTLPATAVSPAAEVQLPENVRCYLSFTAPGPVTVAQTESGAYPVMALLEYGRGFVLVSSIPLEQVLQNEILAGVLMAAVDAASRDIYSLSSLARLLPIQLVLTDEKSEPYELTVKEELPYGVEIYDPLPSPQPGDMKQWNLVIPANGTSAISYWLQLPDQIGTYETVSRLYEGEVKRDEAGLSFEVLQTVMGRIDELSAELNGLSATGADARWLNRARQLLEDLRARGDQLGAAVRDVRSAAGAAHALGHITGMDVSQPRRHVQEIMLYLGRRKAVGSR